MNIEPLPPNTRLGITMAAVFFIGAGIFGMYMWQSGADPDAWQAAGAFLIAGVVLVLMLTRGEKV